MMIHIEANVIILCIICTRYKRMEFKINQIQVSTTQYTYQTSDTRSDIELNKYPEMVSKQDELA